jgi:vacuolar-type H+-ATPase subunit H
MANVSSHGRLKRPYWVRLFPFISIILVIFSAGAINFHLKILEARHLKQEKASLEQSFLVLKAEFQNKISEFSQTALQILSNKDEQLLPNGVFHIGVISPKSPQWEQEVFSKNWTSQDQERFSIVYLKALDSQLSSPSQGALRIQSPSQFAKEEWLSLFFPLPQQDGSNKVLTLLLDPQKSFESFWRHSLPQGSEDIRSYLVTRDGKLFSHSVSTLQGSSLFRAQIFQRALRPSFDLAPQTWTGEYRSLDSVSVTASFGKLENLPFVLVLEKASPTTQNAGTLLFWGRLLSVFGVLLTMNLLIYFLYRRRPEDDVNAAIEGFQAVAVEKENEETLKTQTEAELEKLQEITEKTAEETTEEITEKMNQEVNSENSEIDANAETEHSDILSREEAIKVTYCFQEKVFQWKQKQTPLHETEAEAHFIESISKITQSPSLFFHYHPGTRICLLREEAGFDAQSTPPPLSFPVDPYAQKQIAGFIKENKLASLAHYEPLIRVILQGLGIAHFEAWALTSPAQVSHNTLNEGRLLGVAVILNAGVQSMTHRDLVTHLLNTMGSFYGNHRRIIPTQKSERKDPPLASLFS